MDPVGLFCVCCGKETRVSPASAWPTSCSCGGTSWSTLPPARPEAGRTYPGPVRLFDSGAGMPRLAGSGSASTLPMSDAEKKRAAKREQNRVIGFGLTAPANTD